MKGRARDISLGVLIGVVLAILLMHHDGRSTTPPRPSHSASAHPRGRPAARKTPAAHRSRPSAAAVTARPGRPTGSSGSGSAGSGSAGSLAGTSGAGNELVAAASLIAIAASLFTVTFTVRGLRAAE